MIGKIGLRIIETLTKMDRLLEHIIRDFYTIDEAYSPKVIKQLIDLFKTEIEDFNIDPIDDQTLEISLLHSNPSFIYSLASPATVAIAKEAYDKYGKDLMIGAGPYVYSGENEEDDDLPSHYKQILLEKVADKMSISVSKIDDVL